MSEPRSWKIHKLGNTERWYDPHTRCWWIRVLDADGNQIGECDNCYLATEAKRIQRARAAVSKVRKLLGDPTQTMRGPKRKQRTWPTEGDLVGSLRKDDWQ